LIGTFILPIILLITVNSTFFFLHVIVNLLFFGLKGAGNVQYFSEVHGKVVQADKISQKVKGQVNH